MSTQSLNPNRRRDLASAGNILLQNPVSESSRLRQLRLTPDDLTALKRQGSVQREWRGKLQIYKLRFRRGGKQVVRYLGDAEVARQVAAELAILQATRRASRELHQITKTARETLQESKKKLAPHLDRIGYRFHGFAIRRRRTGTNITAEAAQYSK
jgi:hypothetical protein